MLDWAQVFEDLDFTLIEMNPFTLDQQGAPFPLDMRGELDDTAAFKSGKKCAPPPQQLALDVLPATQCSGATARPSSAARSMRPCRLPCAHRALADLSANQSSTAQAVQRLQLCRWGAELEFPLPFGRTMTGAEEYVHSLDGNTGASLKLSILNPKVRASASACGPVQVRLGPCRCLCRRAQHQCTPWTATQGPPSS